MWESLCQLPGTNYYTSFYFVYCSILTEKTITTYKQIIIRETFISAFKELGLMSSPCIGLNILESVTFSDKMCVDYG